MLTCSKLYLHSSSFGIFFFIFILSIKQEKQFGKSAFLIRIFNISCVGKECDQFMTTKVIILCKKSDREHLFLFKVNFYEKFVLTTT